MIVDVKGEELLSPLTLSIRKGFFSSRHLHSPSPSLDSDRGHWVGVGKVWVHRSTFSMPLDEIQLSTAVVGLGAENFLAIEKVLSLDPNSGKSSLAVMLTLRTTITSRLGVLSDNDLSDCLEILSIDTKNRAFWGLVSFLISILESLAVGLAFWWEVLGHHFRVLEAS